MLLPNYIDIMKEIFDHIDHDNAKIVRRSHLVDALRDDEDVKQFLD